jgi:hypothetical protein
VGLSRYEGEKGMGLEGKLFKLKLNRIHHRNVETIEIPETHEVKHLQHRCPSFTVTFAWELILLKELKGNHEL